jgi:Fe2+ transport system protein FeoA
MSERSSVSLINLRNREKGIIVALTGGHCLISRLSTLGFTQGLLITMIRNNDNGPVIVSVLDTEIALGRRQASCVFVSKKI